MLKITRRPYTACPFRWSLSTSGISTGEGDCSESQCLALNGDFALDFSACASKGDKLVWDTVCLSANPPHPVDCRFPFCDEELMSQLAWTPPVFSIDDADAVYITEESFRGILYHLTPSEFTPSCCWADRQSYSVTTANPDNVTFPPPRITSTGGYAHWLLYPDGLYHSFFSFTAFLGGTYDQLVIEMQLNVSSSDAFGFEAFTKFTAYETGHLTQCQSSYDFTEVPVGPATRSCGTTNIDSSGFLNGVTWSGSVSIDTSSIGLFGPETNDRIRSKWHLSYEIEAQLWTLRSFNRIDYPIYTLSDSDPCTGYTKTLLLADKGSAADGCGVAPSEVTITRVCPPDRVGKSALLEDRKPNGATGKTKRQCGCDCQDEVDDRRSCATKCTSTEDEGCGNINPAPDDITCRYPEAINCCEPTAGLDVPCAYTAEFECDIFFDIEDVRHKIAAKQVVMRRKCYFENGCEFVAAGPESATGGSPVMDVDGFPGAQPVCASCSDPCLTGCTWSAWTVADCPSSVDCRSFPGCNEDLADFTAYVGEITNPLDNTVVAAAQTVTLLQSSSWESDSATINVQMTDGSVLIPCIMVLHLDVSYDGVSQKQPWAQYLADEPSRPCSNIYTFRLVSTLGNITASHVPATIIATRV